MTRNRPKFQKDRPPDQRAVGTDWRLFVAVPMPAPVQELVSTVVSRLDAHGWPVRWVGAESAHLTLHFLGDTPPERAELLRLGLGPAVARHAPFELTSGEPGVFPDFRRPRVLWLGLGGETEKLRALATSIGGALESLGFGVEQRPLHPHITLGRVRDEAPPELGAQVQRALAEPELAELTRAAAIGFPVTEVLLVRSFLERGGARHEPIARYALGGTR